MRSHRLKSFLRGKKLRSHRLSSVPEDEKLRSAPHHSHLNHHVEHHHEDETDGEADGAEIGVLTFGGFGDKFLDDHVEHGAGGEGEHVGKDGHEQRGEQEDGDGSDGFDGTAEGAQEEGAPTAVARRAHRHGDDGTLGHVLDGDAQGDRDGAGQGDVRGTAVSAGEDHANRHSLGEVVDGDGEGEHGGLGEMGTHALGLVGADVQVGRQFVDEQEEAHAQEEAHSGGKDRPFAAVGLHLHGRHQQRPHRRGHHHARGKAQQRLLQAYGHFAAHEEHEGGAEHRAQQGNQESYDECRCHRVDVVIKRMECCE